MQCEGYAATCKRRCSNTGSYKYGDKWLCMQHLQYAQAKDPRPYKILNEEPADETNKGP